MNGTSEQTFEIWKEKWRGKGMIQFTFGSFVALAFIAVEKHFYGVSKWKYKYIEIVFICFDLSYLLFFLLSRNILKFSAKQSTKKFTLPIPACFLCFQFYWSTSGTLRKFQNCYYYTTQDRLCFSASVCSFVYSNGLFSIFSLFFCCQFQLESRAIKIVSCSCCTTK